MSLHTRRSNRLRQLRRGHFGVFLGVCLALQLNLAHGQSTVPSVTILEPAAPPTAVTGRNLGNLEPSTDTAPPPRAFMPAAVTEYSIGEPTAEEQLYLEFINRARANPTAEANFWRNTTDPDVLSALNSFGVDLNLMVAQISALPVAQPLSFNEELIAAARRHTRDMFVVGFQAHIGSDGSNPGSRITAAGYSWNTYGENVYASARSVTHGHGGFEVDWGGGPGGMQTPAGHRQNIHNPNFREIGVGVTNGFNGSVGPQLVTEDLASRSGLTPFITGVVYYDFNGNGAYDLGEGLGGVRVDVGGANFFAISAHSGGYSVPVPGNGTFNVTFSGANLSPVTRSVTVSGGLNVKLDWRPPYTPPAINGPMTVGVGQPVQYTFGAVGGATVYQWKQNKRVNLTAVEGAETGTNNVRVAASASYPVIQTDLRASGTYGWRLAHPQPMDQTVTLNWLVRPGTNGRLELSSRLGWATVSQIARVQITTNGGLSWQDLWSMGGNSTAGQPAFQRVTNSLAPYAGMEVQFRFTYDHAGGSYYNQTSAGVGWYFDDISLPGCEQLVDTRMGGTSGHEFTFTPAETANYSLRVRAGTENGYFDWGPPALPSASTSTAPIVVRITTPPSPAPNMRASFDFVVQSGNPNSFTVELATNPAGPWTTDATATISTLVAGSQFRAQCATSPSGRCFYRIAAR